MMFKSIVYIAIILIGAVYTAQASDNPNTLTAALGRYSLTAEDKTEIERYIDAALRNNEAILNELVKQEKTNNFWLALQDITRDLHEDGNSILTLRNICFTKTFYALLPRENN